MNFYYGLASDIGRLKAINQDKLLLKIDEADDFSEFGLFAAADGMGGMEDGEIASEIAVETLKETVTLGGWKMQLSFIRNNGG